MKHRVFGRQFKRDTNERKALFKGLISSLVLKGRIETTEAKAKSIQGQVDKVVSLAKKGTLQARRELLSFLDKAAVDKLVGQMGSIFASRQSGFTQIIKLGPRRGDNAPMVFLQWVGWEERKKEEMKLNEKEKKETKTVARKAEEKSEKSHSGIRNGSNKSQKAFRSEVK